MELNVKIEKTSSEEIGEIAEIYAEEFSKEPYNEKWTKEKAVDKIKLLLKYCEVYTVYSDRKVVGFFAVNPNFMFPGDFAFGEEFAIREIYQNKGIGSFCMKWIEKEYSQRGYKELMFIASRKSKAFKIYKKLGYVEDDEGVLMNKELK